MRGRDGTKRSRRLRKYDFVRADEETGDAGLIAMRRSLESWSMWERIFALLLLLVLAIVIAILVTVIIDTWEFDEFNSGSSCMPIMGGTGCTAAYKFQGKCHYVPRKPGALCSSVCFASGVNNTQECVVVQDGKSEPVGMCMGDECLGTCDDVTTCPNVTTLFFSDAVDIIGTNTTCTNGRCVYEINTAAGVDGRPCLDSYIENDCKRFVRTTWLQCLDVQGLCGLATVPSARDVHTRIPDVDQCYYQFACADAVATIL